MVTAADGAPEFYTGLNNEARYENVEEACALDKKLINAWVGHPQFQIVDNKSSQSFDAKIDRTLAAVYKMIGLPSNQQHSKKFLLVTLPQQFDIMTPKNTKKEVFTVEETYLHDTSDRIEAFIQKVGKNDSFVYSYENRSYQNKQRILRKRQISAREYIESMDQRKKTSKDIKKFRQCFIYEGQYYIVETFLNVDQQPSLLRLETSHDQEQTTMPKFLKVLREVTMDEEYSRNELCKSGWKMPGSDKKNMSEAQAQLLKEMQA